MAPKKSTNCYVLGVGMTKFIKPRGEVEYTEMALEAGVKAMLDAGINYDEVEQGVACYVYGDSTCGQRVFYQFGMTKIPIYNVNNNCSTGSTGLYMGRSFVTSGASDCVLVVGFEKMAPGSLSSKWDDRESPMQGSVMMMMETRGFETGPPTCQLFGNAGREHMEKYGSTADDYAEIARVNHEHSTRNPYAQFRKEYTLEEVKSSGMMHDPLTKLQCCPTSDGAGAAVLVSEEFLNQRPHLRSHAVLIAGQCLATDEPSLYNRSAIDLMGYGMVDYAAKTAFAEANASPKDVTVCELHDCFSANEMISLEALGLAEKGKAHEMVRKGDITYGGRVVVNPSGGLISKGHPLGATGLAQCTELVWQLRGWAGDRLVPDTTTALQHNIGLGGAVVVTVYKRSDGKACVKVSDEEAAKASGLGYNPAVQAKGFTKEQFEKVRSKHFSDWALGETLDKITARL
ncbi:thiolase-like protein [Eremomyces bilateralis CBS 781.70]|uniref:propanoyl-CoA C-acyltransferase n=1 Tax=Eremomyces bilateralis CBS 781.70 TaxID=1392243 RepID=A0A6G1G173_9PEZI|nr:thiolase-like protein [Eremomyces bilateralis CBS 781.70]KAF1811681.1 thiolase-like protein [Eremomyces bilateralis CBS 781.70]